MESRTHELLTIQFVGMLYIYYYEVTNYTMSNSHEL